MELMKHIIDKVSSFLETSYMVKGKEKQASERREYLLKEVEVVQDIIKRMSSNSFLIKGWTITLVVGALLLNGNQFHVIVAYIPLLVFWSLDAYFLRQERMYRKLHEWVIKNRLKTEDHLFDLNATRFRDEVPSSIETMFSTTLLVFYGSIGVSILIYMFLHNLCTGNNVPSDLNNTLSFIMSNRSNSR